MSNYENSSSKGFNISKLYENHDLDQNFEVFNNILDSQNFNSFQVGNIIDQQLGQEESKSQIKSFATIDKESNFLQVSDKVCSISSFNHQISTQSICPQKYQILNSKSQLEIKKAQQEEQRKKNRVKSQKYRESEKQLKENLKRKILEQQEEIHQISQENKQLQEIIQGCDSCWKIFQQKKQQTVSKQQQKKLLNRTN